MGQSFEKISFDSPIDIRRIGRKDLEQASGPVRLLARNARDAGLELSHLWGGFDSEQRLRHCALLVPQSGRCAMLFHTPPIGTLGIRELAAVIDTACLNLDRTQATLVQALPDPLDTPTHQALEKAGLWKLAELDYLRLSLSHLDPLSRPDHSAGLKILTWDKSLRPRFLEALEQSYKNTLDCPKLNDLRTAEDALASHMTCGLFDPDFWLLLQSQGQTAGVLLLNPLHQPDTAELVYLGLRTENRGQGMGRRLLLEGLQKLRNKGFQEVILAVDQNNLPATGLYQKLGFRRTDRRTAMIRSLV